MHLFPLYLMQATDLSSDCTWEPSAQKKINNKAQKLMLMSTIQQRKTRDERRGQRKNNQKISSHAVQSCAFLHFQYCPL